MTTYTIDTENSITAHASKQEAGEGESFTTQEELASLAGAWPATRLVEVWNGIPGLAPAKKLKDRKAAVGKIWAAIQGLDGGATESAKPAQTTATAARKPATKAKDASKPKPTKAAKATPAKKGRKTVGKAVPKRTSKPAQARDGSKKATVLALLQRKNGATLAEIMKATQWQAHSVRGFISGALGKNMGLTVNSAKRQDGERVYSIG